jgi:chromosome segregation ATPase
MSEGYIAREEHEEFRRRMEDEHTRINKRVSLLEQNTQQISALTTSVEKLALSIESMVKEQEQQGKRLEVLEGRDGEMWRKVVGYVIVTITGIVIGYIFTQIGM